MNSDIFGAVFQNLRTGALLLERATGRIQAANPAFQRMCGFPQKELAGRNFWAPPLVDDQEAGAELFAHLRAGGAVEGAQLPLQTRDGSCLLLEINGGAVDASTVQLEVRDATAQHGARMADRMEAQRALAIRVAAEFNDMHRALKSAGELVGNCARRGQATFQESDEVRKAADRASAITRELLAYSGQLPLDPHPTQLNDLIGEMQPALQQLLGEDIEVVSELSRDASPVMVDAAQIRQILLKLAANSGEAMAHRGKFRIATRNVSANDATVAHAGKGGSYAMLEVTDQGPGLDDASWEHLYEPFFTTKQHGRRGLGLAAVNGLVRQMGGLLWAHSEPGQGASFRIYLPVAIPVAQSVPAGPATILLMEQNEGLRTVVANILKKRGYRVMAAQAPADALEMAQTQGSPDLLISEPDTNLVKSLARLHPELRTLFLNGHSDHGGVPTLSKPFEVETLLDRVSELLKT